MKIFCITFCSQEGEGETKVANDKTPPTRQTSSSSVCSSNGPMSIVMIVPETTKAIALGPYFFCFVCSDVHVNFIPDSIFCFVVDL